MPSPDSYSGFFWEAVLSISVGGLMMRECPTDFVHTPPKHPYRAIRSGSVNTSLVFVNRRFNPQLRGVSGWVQIQDFPGTTAAGSGVYLWDPRSCAQFLTSPRIFLQINEGRDVQKETRCGTSGFWLCKSSCADRERSGENHSILIFIFQDFWFYVEEVNL